MEWLAVRVWAGCIGVSAVVRYARNPSPNVLVRLLKHYGATIGPGTTIKGALHIDNVWQDRDSTGDFSHLVIGRNCYIGIGACFDLANQVTLEDDVVVSGEVAFITHSEVNRSPVLAPQFPRESAPIVVGTGSWLGFRSILAHGVTVEPASVVAAGAIVTRGTHVSGLYAGIPARKVRDLAAGEARSQRS